MGERGIKKKRGNKKEKGINQTLEQGKQVTATQQMTEYCSISHWIHPLNLFFSPFLFPQAKKGVN